MVVSGDVGFGAAVVDDGDDYDGYGGCDYHYYESDDGYLIVMHNSNYYDGANYCIDYSMIYAIDNYYYGNGVGVADDVDFDVDFDEYYLWSWLLRSKLK